MVNKDTQLEELQQHFSRRVVSDARSVVDQWHQLQSASWQPAWFEALVKRAERLDKSSRRYDRADMTAEANRLLSVLGGCQPDRAPASDELAELSDAIGELSQLAARQTDEVVPGQAAFVRQDVYVAIADEAVAQDLASQLESFGVPCLVTPTPEALEEARAYRRPIAILIDVDFHGMDEGFVLLESLQRHVTDPVPVVFFSDRAPDMEQRLRALRAGGRGFVDQNAGLLSVVDRLQSETQVGVPDLFRVLIVDDSRTQAAHASQALNAAGMLTEIESNPLALLDRIDEFQPDIILMDMYMPRCDGVELAMVMRQQPQYDRLPIIFLSAEEDMAKQMHAMAEGGDDFLTKSVNADILVATVRHRCKRNRAVRNWMERDSLTGLLDHTHLLQRLEQALVRNERQGGRLCFVMLDLDKFKSVNDTWGHGAGDRVLQNLSLLLRQRLRKTDIIGRYGGEEFAVIMPDTGGADAEDVLNELLASFGRVRHPVSQGDEQQSIHCTFSGGIAEWQPGESGSDLSARADQALYAAKEAGRARLQLADQTVDRR